MLKVFRCVAKFFPEKLISKNDFAKVSIISTSDKEASVSRTSQRLKLIVLDKIKDVLLRLNLLEHHIMLALIVEKESLDLSKGVKDAEIKVFAP